MTIEQISSQIKWDAEGLAPAVVQDAGSKDVLMMAYMNEESLRLSAESGETWFWSRSRRELWHKGATSGNIQKIQSMSYDCDGDTLLIRVKPAGPACHTGKYSCFYNEIHVGEGDASATTAHKSPDTVDGQETSADTSILIDSAAAPSPADRFAMLGLLESVIARRDAERPEGAYTTYLFEQGVDKILKKVGEETAEVIIAAKNRDNEELRYETSDLIFHLLVLLRNAGLPLDELMKELERRHVKQ